MAFENGLLTTAYLTFAHNQVAIAFFVGTILSILLAFKYPNRINVALIVGFSLLLLGFEYNKHISEPLIEQTTQSLATDGKIGRADKAIGYFLSILLPMFFYIGGWGLVFLSILGLNIKNKKSKD